jgi:hypothetical protein
MVDIATEVKSVPAAQTLIMPMQPQQTESLPLTLPPLPISSDASRILEEEQSPLISIAQLVTVEPAAKAAAVAAPTDLQSTQAKSLEKLLVSSDKIEPSLEEAPSLPTLHARLDDIETDTRAAAVSTAPSMDGAATRAKPLLAALELDTAIRLRWVMRDIRANRRTTSPVSENDLATLVELGLVEMRETRPSLTALGLLELN